VAVDAQREDQLQDPRALAAEVPVIAVVGKKEAEERKLAQSGASGSQDAKIFLADEALPPDLKRAKVG
jgi:hypothetical protein